jgi:tetratricopeptide (TPR) repeat protein
VRIKEHAFPAALPLLDKAFSDLPLTQRRVREASLLASNGAPSQAITLLEQSAEADPTSYEALYNLAVLRLEQKDADGAMTAARQALALKDTGELHDLLGDICESQHQYGDALNHYQEAVRLDPNSDKFAFDLGAELLLHENFEAAQKVFSAAQQRFPKSARIDLGLGTADFLRGKTSEAVDAYLSAVNLDPAFEPGYLFLGEAFTFSGSRSSEVAAKLQQLAEKRTNSFELQFYYGSAVVQQMADTKVQANATRALVALQRAASLQPRDARVYYQLGELSRLEGRPADAANYYRKAIDLDPNFPEPLYKLGQTYVRMGRRTEAKAIFARHREVSGKAEAALYHRSNNIESFVLTMKKAP